MVNGAAMSALATALVLLAQTAHAEDNDKEPVLLELGAASEWSLLDGTGSLGPNAALDIPVIENWLEIEAGVSALFGNNHMEWDSGLLFKKPYALSESVEFEVGVGPAWLHTTGGGRTTNSLGGEAAIEFQVFPWPDRKLGWFLEPSYGYDFGRGHEQSLGVTLGLLIPLR
jgi:hypothetical protein